MSDHITSNELRTIADSLRPTCLLDRTVAALESAADTIDALTRELTEAASGDDRLEREQAARIEELEAERAVLVGSASHITDRAYYESLSKRDRDAARRGRIGGLLWAAAKMKFANSLNECRVDVFDEVDRLEAEAKREANTDPIVDDEDQVRYPGQQWRVCRRCGALYPPDKACLNDAFHSVKREAGR